MLVFLDANALFSDWQRALWLSFAQCSGATELVCSSLVLDECFRNLLRLNHLTEEGAQRSRLAWLQSPFVHQVDDADAYLADVRSVHEKDRHVAAAALKWRHHRQVPGITLMTWNIRDFPRPALRRVGIDRLSPDEWLRDCIKRDAALACALLDQSLQLAQAARTELADCLSDYQRRASGFPQSGAQWPEFLRRTGFRQSATALERSADPAFTRLNGLPLTSG